jgi:hypothetical protein
MDYSSTVAGEGGQGGGPLLASMIRMRFGTLMLHLSGPLVRRRIVDAVAADVLGEGISKDAIDRSIVAILREEVIRYLADRSLDEEQILAAVRELSTERVEHLDALRALRSS